MRYDMLNRLDIVIDNNNLNSNMMSLFQGVLMENIDTEYADILHNATINPYSQYLFFDKKISKYIWRINTISKKANEKIIDVIQKNIKNKIYLRKKDLELDIVDIKTYNKITYEELIAKYYINNNSNRFIKIYFRTPTSFKSNGIYQIFPDLRLIYQSLLKKFDVYATRFSLYDEDVLNNIVNNTIIKSYNLKSTHFYLEKVRIDSFIGKFNIKVIGSDCLISLVNLILAFGEYSGLGIKSSIGMGGIMIE
jgi:CRISPR-associated endoribonuclease Cas6